MEASTEENIKRSYKTE